MRHPAPTLVIGLLVLLTACATRSVNDTLIDEYDLTIKLRSEKPAFGFETVKRGYAQPVDVSAARLEAILAGIQVDMRESDHSSIRERSYAIPRPLLQDVAEGLSVAFAEASPDQRIVVFALRKQMQKGIFNRKYLTSFTTWIEGDRMIVQLSRIDWKVEQYYKDQKLPAPEVGEFVMPFNTVATDLYAVAGRQGVSVDWQSGAFGGDAIEANIAGQRTGADEGDAAPAATAGEAVAAPGDATATATGSVPATAAEATSADPGAASADPPGVVPGSVDADRVIRGLSPEDLRRLADLEEARAAGTIDASEYEVRRQEILGRIR